MDTSVESLTEYNNGELYPVHIDDQFQDGRYQVLNKLGVGGFSTVWAARDHYKNTNVALKVIKAEHSENNKELRILQRIQTDATQHPGHKYLPQLLDHFYQGTRKHLFLVLELLGPSIQTVISYLPNQNFSLSRSRQISKQLLLAVDCLHSYGIVHGDIYESNILFRLPADWELDLAYIRRSEVSKDGAPLEEGIPRYLVKPIEFDWERNGMDLEKFDHIQLIDFSSSFFDSDEPPKMVNTPAHISSPELIFEKPLSKSIDIWSLACATFYCAVTESPFYTLGAKHTILRQIHKVLGESSADWLLTAMFDGGLPNFKFSKFNCRYTLEEALYEYYRNGQSSISDTEKKQFKALEHYLRRALVVDPLKRATTEELKAEEWVRL